MPRPRQANAARRSDLHRWEMVFASGCDFFNELPHGIIDEYGRPERKTAREAWDRLGAEFMEKFGAENTALRHPLPDSPWAIQEFGPPKAARAARRYTY